MRVVKLKGGKYADVILGGEAHIGPSVVNVVTRQKTTTHGDFFKELVKAALPQIIELSDKVGYEDRTRVPRYVVGICERVAMETMDAIGRNKALGVTIPSYEGLVAKLNGDATSQPEVSGDVVSLFERQEKEP